MCLKEMILRSDFLSFSDDFRYAWATIVALCSQGLTQGLTDNIYLKMSEYEFDEFLRITNPILRPIRAVLLFLIQKTFLPCTLDTSLLNLKYKTFNIGINLKIIFLLKKLPGRVHWTRVYLTLNLILSK
jgi:hypothetical protein